jgi:hypothetical protein
MFPDAFLAHHAAHFDFSKACKFGVLIFQPTGLIAGGLLGGLIGQTAVTRFAMKPLNTAGLALQCEQASLPGYNLNTVEQKIYGAPWSIAAQPGDYLPLELTFISAGDLWERKFFEDWMEFIVPKGSIRNTADSFVGNFTENLVNSDGGSRAAGSATYRNEYISTIQVIQFHDTGIPSARYTFEEAYPVSIAPQPLNWGDDSINRVNVTFKYTTWSREKNIIRQIYDRFKIPGGEAIVSELDGTITPYGDQ